MKNHKWTKFDVLKVINTVVNNNSVEYSEINKQLSEYFGISEHAVVCSRVSIMRILQNADSTIAKGSLKGYSYSDQYKETVNDWYENHYGGGTSRNALSFKFYG